MCLGVPRKVVERPQQDAACGGREDDRNFSRVPASGRPAATRTSRRLAALRASLALNALQQGCPLALDLDGLDSDLFEDVRTPDLKASTTSTTSMATQGPERGNEFAAEATYLASASSREKFLELAESLEICAAAARAAVDARR